MINLEDLETRELQRQQSNAINIYNQQDAKEIKGHTYNSANDGLILKTATISTPETNITYSKYDPIDANEHINLSTGKCNISWTDESGGVTRYPQNANGSASWKTIETEQNPEERTNPGQASNSGRELVNITSPCIWTGNNNWAGISSIPPVGSKCIVGKGKHNEAMILGYMPVKWASITPILKAGETCIKGYGQNYIHFRQSDKLDIFAKTSAGAEDYETGGTSGDDCTCMIRLNANESNITISIGGSGESSAIFMTPDEITVTTGTLNLQARDLINMDAPMITQN